MNQFLRTFPYRTFSLLVLFCALFSQVQAQVDVTATGGTPAASYTTLKAAFDAVNLGTHTGSISIAITGNTTETATAALNNSGSGAASYTDLSIAPTVPATISGSIAGAVIKLNGADNVTIDGRIGGTGRNLTIQNTSTSTGSAAVWLASVAVGNGVTGSTIRNCEIACGVTQNTATTTTFGIIMSGTTISLTANGTDNDNNSFIANRIIRCRYGIATRGTTTNLNETIQVLNNIVGPAAFGADQIGKTGIFMQADNNSTVSGNLVQFVGGDYANTTGGADRNGIAIGVDAWSMSPGTLTSTNYTVTNNIIHDVIEERTFSAVGLLLGTTNGGAATNNLVANNAIYNIKSNGTLGDQVAGLGISGGLGDRVVFNSIRMQGDVDPNPSASPTSNFGSGIRVGNTSSLTFTNLTLQNNVVYMDLSSSSTVGVRYYAISGPNNAFNWGTGGENYNDYYINPANTQLQTGGLGTASGNTLTTQFATLANWQTAYTAPQDANSIQLDPGFISPTDLHISTGSTAVDNVGTPIVGVTTDVDGDVRAGSPDMGWDEYTPLVCAGAAGGTITPATASRCAGQTVSMSSVGAEVGLGVSYQWEVSSTGGGVGFSDVVGGTGATTVSYTTTALTAGTYYYRLRVFCSIAAITGYSNEFVVTVNPLPTVAVSPSSATYCNPSSGVVLTASGADTYAWSPATGLSATTGTSVTATPTATTTYTVTGTVTATGCTNTATTVITSVFGPAISATTATPATICSGENSQLQTTATVAYNQTVNQYSFAQSNVAYTPLAGGTTSTAIGDDGTQTAIPIGFTFNYGGTNYTTFSISTNGTIRMGGTASGFTNDLDGVVDVLAPFWDDNHLGSGTITYLVSGTAPNQVLTIDWFNTAVGGGGSSANSTNQYQIRIYETTNVIEFHYGSLTSANGISASIGLSGAIGNFISVTPAATATVSTTVENATIAAVTDIPAGTLYTFTPPAAPTLTYAWSPATFLSDPAIANPIATAVTATTPYSVTVTANGCTATGSAPVTVSAAAIANAGSNQSICSGSVANLSATTSGAGTWSGGTGTFANATNPVTTYTHGVGETSATLTWTTAAVGSCPAASDDMILTISTPVTVSAGPVAAFCNSATTFNLPVVVTGSPTTYSITAVAPTPMPGFVAVTNAPYSASPIAVTIPAATPQGTYTFQISMNNGGACANGTSNFSVTVDAPIAAPSTTTPTLTLCQNTTGTLNAGCGSSVTVGTPITINLTNLTVNEPVAAPGANIGSFTFPALPAGAVVTAAALNITGVALNGGSYASECRINFTGAATLSMQGATSTTTPNPFNWSYSAAALATALPAAGGTINLGYFDTYNDVTAGSDVTFPATATLTYSYSVPNPITWYDAPTGGTVVGTGSPLTFSSTLPTASINTATGGTYTVYSECGPLNTCNSAARTTHTVTVQASITATTPSSIVPVCNNATSFSLPLSTTGSPDQYSVSSTMPGFVPVVNAVYSGSPLTINIPSGAASDLYPFTVTLVNTSIAGACGTVAVNFDLEVQAPSATTNTNVSVCQNSTSNLTASCNTITISRTVSIPLTNISVNEGTAAPGANVGSFSFPALPAGATITAAALNVTGISLNGGSYASECILTLSGAATPLSMQGATSTTTPNPFNWSYSAAPLAAALPAVAGGTVNVGYFETYNDVTAGPDVTFPATAVLTYTFSYSPSVTWWDAVTGGTQIGTGPTLSLSPTTPTGALNTANVANFTVYAQCGNVCATTRSSYNVNVGPSASTPATTIVCPNPGGSSTGSITVTAPAAVPGYTWNYAVSAANSGTLGAYSTSNVFSGLGNGVYNVSVVPFLGAVPTPCGASTLVNLTAPPAPVSPVNQVICQDGTPAPLQATCATYTDSISFTVPITSTGEEVNTYPGKSIASFTLPNIPAGLTIQSVDVLLNNIVPVPAAQQNQCFIGLFGAMATNGTGTPSLFSGVGVTTATTAFNYTRTYAPGTATAFSVDIVPTGGVVDVRYADNNTTNSSVGADDHTLPSSLIVKLRFAPAATTQNWYATASSTTVLGTGSSFDAVVDGGVNTATPNTYTFYSACDPATGCPGARTAVTLTVNPKAVVNVGAPTQSYCSNQTVNAVAVLTGVSSGTWGTSGDGTFGNASNASTTYAPGTNDLSAGVVTLTFTSADPDGAGPCVAASGSFAAVFDPAPIANAGGDQVICAGSTVSLSGTSTFGVSSIASTWTTSGSGAFANASNPVTTYTPNAADISAGTVTLTLTTADPAGPCGAGTDAMIVTINAAPTVGAGLDATICEGAPYTLQGVIGGSATSATWTGGAGAFNPSNTAVNAAYTPSAADQLAGSVTLTLTTNDPDGAGPCSAVSDNVVLTINQAATVDAGLPQTVCQGTPVTMNALFGGAANLANWTTSGAGTFDDATSIFAVYTLDPLEIDNTILTFTTDDPDGAGPCAAATSSVIITFNAPATTNNAFTDINAACASPFGAGTFPADNCNAIAQAFRMGNPNENQAGMGGMQIMADCSGISLEENPIFMVVNCPFTGTLNVAVAPTGNNISTLEAALFGPINAGCWVSPLGTSSICDVEAPATTINLTSPATAGDKFLLVIDTDGDKSGFDVTFAGSALPVELLSFTGYRQGNENILNWATAKEQNVARFDLERSVNGVDFTQIGSRQAAGNTNSTTNYSFTDYAPNMGVNLYRLKMVDLDGTFKYSDNLVELNLNDMDFSASVYPNPVKDILHLVFEGVANGVRFDLYDATGKVVVSKVYEQNGTVSDDIDVSDLSEGIYLYRATYEGRVVEGKVTRLNK